MLKTTVKQIYKCKRLPLKVCSITYLSHENVRRRLYFVVQPRPAALENVLCCITVRDEATSLLPVSKALYCSHNYVSCSSLIATQGEGRWAEGVGVNAPRE